MKNANHKFPIYKTKKQSPKNDFQSQYRNEIKELISGTEYLDQIISNRRTPTKDENNSPNFNSLTPEAKRKLMFQKPVSLVKRQTNYYSRHPKKPFQNNKNQDDLKEIQNFCQTSPELPINVYQFSPMEKINRKSPKKAIYNPSPVHDNFMHVDQKQNQGEYPKQITKVNYNYTPKSIKQEKRIEIDADSFESEDKIVIKHFSIKNTNDDSDMLNSDDQSDQERYINPKNGGFNYFQTTFDQENQSEEENSVDFSSEKKMDSVYDDYSNSGSVHFQIDDKNKFSLDENAPKMTYYDTIEAEVNFTSDSSSDFEFQSQFFVQENVVKSSNANSTNCCGKFLSSEAIESYSDD